MLGWKKTKYYDTPDAKENMYFYIEKIDILHEYALRKGTYA